MKQKSFTLIELLVVIAIIGLLSSIVLVASKEAGERTKIARMLQFSSIVHHAVGAYLVGEWKFNEGHGNKVSDSSGYGNDGTWQGTRTDHWVESDIPQLGMAGQTTGRTDYVKVEDSKFLEGMNELTLQIWIKPLNEMNEARVPFTKPQSYEIQFYNSASTGEIYFIIVTEAGNSKYMLINDIKLFETGKWYHIVATYYGGEGDAKPRMRLYLNGHLVKTEIMQSWPTPSPINAPSGLTGLYIGSNIGSKRSIVDEARIYHGELTQSQIKKLYAEGAKKHGLLATY